MHPSAGVPQRFRTTMKTTTTKETKNHDADKYIDNIQHGSNIPLHIDPLSIKEASQCISTDRFPQFKIHFLCFVVKVIASSGQDRLSVFQIKNLSIPRFQDGRLVLRRGRRKRRVGGQGWFQTKRKYKEMTRESRVLNFRDFCLHSNF